MHQFLKGHFKRSILILKSLIFSGIILSSLTSVAQVSKSELNQLQKEINFKIIKFTVFGVNSDEEAIRFKSDLERLAGVRDCEVDYQNHQCVIIAGFAVQKSEVLSLTGRAGVKVSDYSEEIRWRTNQNSYNKIQYTDEKARAKELKATSPEEDEKMQGQIEMRRKTESAIAEKEKQQAIRTPSEYDLPENYPKYHDSGNQVEDDRKYAKAKSEWIHENPDIYRQIFTNKENNITEISHQEFKKMSGEKQRKIKSNPSKYIIIK